MKARGLLPGDVARHLRALRALNAAFLLTVPAAFVVGRTLPHLPLLRRARVAVTVTAFVVALWIALRADRISRRMLEPIKVGYASHGDPHRLLAGHRAVYLKVFLLVELVVLCGLVVALMGTGPGSAVWLYGVAVVLFLLAWPTERKTRLLLRRAEELRNHGSD